MTKTLKDLFLSGNYPEPKKVDTTPISDDVSYDVDDKGAFLGKADWKYGTDYRDVGPENKIDFSLFGSEKIKLGDNTPNIFVSALDIVEAETNPRGIRISSAVELNNPLLYGNEATRIALRSTTILDRMKASRSNLPSELGNLAKVRDKINSSKLFGLTQPVTPTVVFEHTDSNGNNTLKTNPIPNRYSDISEIIGGQTKKNIQDVLSKSVGTPEIAARQLAGGIVSIAKDDVRECFFNDPTGISSNTKRVSNFDFHLTNQLCGETYSDKTNCGNSIFGMETVCAVNCLNNCKSTWDSSKKSIGNGRPNKFKLNSPAFGLSRCNDKFGTSNYAFVDKENATRKLIDASGSGSYSIDPVTNGPRVDELDTIKNPNPRPSERVQRFVCSSPIYGIFRSNNTFGKTDNAFQDKTGIANQMYNVNISNGSTVCDNTYSKLINSCNYSPTLATQGFGDSSSTTGYTDVLNSSNSITSGPNADTDTDNFLLNNESFPFWFRDIRDNTTTIFRATITNFSETITPDWEEGSFVGNPYKFKSYSGVSRSVSVDFKIFTLTPDELAANWYKMKHLTKMAYPMFLTSNKKLTSAPIIRFRIGDVYSKRYAVIDNLTYTISEDSTWETVTDAQVPKLIDVSMTLYLLENIGAEDKPYDFANNSASLPNPIKQKIDKARNSAALATSIKT
jgi:hypothetical protein